MDRRVFGTFLCWLILVVTAAASEGPPSVAKQEVDTILAKQHITLADLFRVAELGNPALAAAEASVSASAGRARQAGLYPNPIFELEVEELSTADPDIRKDKVTVMQPIVISGRRGDAVASARAGEEAAAHVFEQTRRYIFRSIHSRWADLLYIREAEGVLVDLLGVAQQTLAIAQVRFEARAAPESQVTKALLETYEHEVARQRLAQQRARTEAELVALLGGVWIPMDRLASTLGAEIPAEEAFERDLAQHPSLGAAASRVEAAQAALRAAKSERVPDLGVFVSYGRARPTDNGFLEAGISVPIPLFNRNQGRVAEGHALVAETQAQMRFVEGDLQVTLAAANARHQAIRSELRTSNDLIQPAAEKGLAQAQEGYRAGRLPFLELIDAQRTYSNIRLRNLELRRDLVIAEAELLSLAGTGLYANTGDRP